jgi:hypothetical protein
LLRAQTGATERTLTALNTLLDTGDQSASRVTQQNAQ